MVIAVIVGYALGFVLCYRQIRRIVYYKNGGDWLLLEKLVAIVLCLFSWAMLASIILLKSPLLKNIDLDKKCKW